MTTNVYVRLREQLDEYSLGYPTTESGVEFKILEKLFTEEEGEMFLQLNLRAELPEVIAQRIGREPDEVSSLLHQMAQKGLVFRLGKGDEVKYSAAPFVAGIYEFQLGTMDREFAELMEAYAEEAFHEATAEGATFMRPIPIQRAVDTARLVSTYDDSRELVKKQNLIAVADCICRVQKGLIDQACDKPLEVCFLFGSWGQYFMDRNMARQVSVEEALGILDKAEEAGLVTQPANAQKPSAICNCCGDCCAVLQALNRHPRPAEQVVSNYFAAVDPELCTACETCLDRCQMAAITINDDDVAEINLDRCIGCGLCVTTCPEEALCLELKPEDQRRMPPEKASQALIEIAKKRGKSLVPIALKTK